MGLQIGLDKKRLWPKKSHLSLEEENKLLIAEFLYLKKSIKQKGSDNEKRGVVFYRSFWKDRSYHHIYSINYCITCWVLQMEKEKEKRLRDDQYQDVLNLFIRFLRHHGVHMEKSELKQIYFANMDSYQS